jgi:hypothetical protein
MTTETLDAMTSNLASEGEVPSLADFAEEPGGALTTGWYAADIIEGYTTRKAGKVFTTSDNPSGKGDSRNLRLCFNVATGGEPRQMQESFNYRTSDFTPERLDYIKQARQDHKGVQGRWNDDPDGQRSSLAVAKLGAIEKSLGFPLRTPDGMAPAKAIGHSVDVFIGIKDGFNEVTKFAKAGEKVKRAA